MKKRTRRITNVCLSVFLAVPGLIAAPAMAEVIDWNGDEEQLRDIEYTTPDGTDTLSDTLAPLTDSSFNTVTANSGTATHIVGGFSQTGNVTDNTVTVNAGVLVGSATYGGFSVTGDATRNTVIVNAGEQGSYFVYGGYSLQGSANNNSITATGPTHFGLQGGYARAGDANDNRVTVYASGEVSSITGGRSDFSAANSVGGSTGQANHNTVGIVINTAVDLINTSTIRGGEVIYGSANINAVDISVLGGDQLFAGDVIGGRSDGGGTTNGNTVNLTISDVGELTLDSITGGLSEDGDASGNTVTISVSGGDTVDIGGSPSGGSGGGVIGGSSGGDGSANSNRVNLSVSGSDTPWITEVTGGRSVQGDANGNTVEVAMTGGQENDERNSSISDIRGGYSSGTGGDANSNRVTVFQTGTSNLQVSNLVGGLSDESGNANNNFVQVTQVADQTGDGRVATVSVAGGQSSGEANNNTVHVETSGYAVAIYGGYGAEGASNNAVFIKADGGGGEIRGGSASQGDANNNTVTVVFGQIYSNPSRITGGESEQGSANGNTVILRDSYAGGEVYGGFIGGGDGTQTANNNTVTLEGATNFMGSIYGGSTYGTTADVYSGNTLNIWNYTGTDLAHEIGNFENYNFILANTVTSGDSILTAYRIDYGAGARVTGIDVTPGGQALRPGDYVILIDATESSGTVTDGEMVQGTDGQFTTYNWIVGQEGTQDLYARLDSTTTNQDRSDPIIAGRIGGLAGLMFLSDSNLESIKPSQPGITPFFISQGGRSSYDASSADIDINGFNAMGGFAWNEHFDEGKLMIAAFAEGGWGSYDTKSSAGYNGDGDTHFYGGGIMGRFDLPSTPSGNLYAEASFRAGYASTDFESNDLRDFNGAGASYDTSSHYLRGHAGIGYQWTVTETSGFDLYSRYFWTQLGSDDVSVWSSRVHFDSVDSHKWRTGGRYNHTVVTESGLVFKPYFGAAYEHEFGSTVEGSVDGIAFRGDDLKGGTMMSEIGLSFSPSVNDNLHAELGVQGYLGQRVGVNGQFRIKYTF